MKPFALALSTSAIGSAWLVATFATCAVYGPLPSMSDEGYTFGISSSPLAARARRSMVSESSLPGSRTDVTPIDSSCKPGEVVGHVHVAVPQSRQQRLAAAVDDLRAGRHLRRLRRADAR